MDSPQYTERITLKKGFFVFFSAILTNFFWVLCLRRINQGAALDAAVINFGLSILAVYVTRSYVKNRLYGIIAALGFSVGTFITVTLDSNHFFSRILH